MNNVINTPIIVVISTLILLSLSLVSCSDKDKTEVQSEVPVDTIIVRDFEDIIADDTLRVATMYGPTSYYSYREEDFGYEYDMSQLLAKAMGVNMKLLVAVNEDSLLNLIQRGEADLIAYKLPYTDSIKQIVNFTNKEYITEQVVVQCSSDSMARDVLELCNKDVYVRKGTIYDLRLQNLNNEVGGGINIKYVPDTVSSDDLISLVAAHKIGMTIVSDDIAKLGDTYSANLDFSLGVSFPQRSAWAVNKGADSLAIYINNWVAKKEKSKEFRSVYRKYFDKKRRSIPSDVAVNVVEKPKEPKQVDRPAIHVTTPKEKSRNTISVYDEIIKRYAADLGWDWRLLAALIFKESRFNPTIVSWAGARGLMQLMPKTARALGANGDSDMFDPETSIRIGSIYIQRLDKMFSSVPDVNEKIKFVLASYNSGPGHIIDARALARKYGKDPNVWEGNVETYLLLKSEPEYYSDPVCKSGYCRGSGVARYVIEVLNKWQEYQTWDLQ